MDNRIATRISWLFICALLVLAFFYSVNRWFDSDEFFALHDAWKILHGERAYVDFLQLHHPLFHWLLAPVIAFTGETASTLITARVLVFIALLMILGVTYSLSRRVFNRETAVVSVLFLLSSYHFLFKAIEVRPDVPQTLFGLISILFLLIYIEHRTLKNLALSSFFLGVSFLFLQKTAFLILVTEGLLFFYLYKRRLRFKAILVHWAVFVLTVAPFYAYIFYKGLFRPYLMFNWVIHARLLEHFLPYNMFLEFMALNSWLWGFYALGLLFFMKTPGQKRLAVLSLVLTGTIFVARAPNQQYILMPMPLIASVSAYAALSAFKDNKNMLAVIIFFSILSPSALLVWNLKNTNDSQLKKVEYVLSVTATEDRVFDGNVFFNLFRRDIDYFWYSGNPGEGVLATYQMMTGYHFDAAEAIDRLKPRVISNLYIKDMRDPRIEKHYGQSNVYGDLYIRKD